VAGLTRRQPPLSSPTNWSGSSRP